MSTPPRVFRSPKRTADLVQIAGSSAEISVVPSRFNAHTVAADGSLILFNSYSAAFSIFPPHARDQVEFLLRRAGARVPASGVSRYLLERGFLVAKGTDELQRVRYLFGQLQYRSDLMELILLASEECNFRCVYCYETFPRGTMEEWVRSAVVRWVEAKVRTLSQIKLEWFGGEPLLGYEAIRDIAPHVQRIAKDNDVHYHSSMTTNGYLLTEETFASLVNWGINTFQITLDGPQECHDAKRPLAGGGSTYEQILTNLLAASRSSYDFHIFLRINFDHDNLPYVPEYMSFLKDRFGNDRRFELRFYPVGQWGGENDEKLQVCGRGGVGERQALELMAIEHGIQTETHFDHMHPSKGLNVCYAARPYSFIVGADGKLMKCTIALDKKDYNIVGSLSRKGSPHIDIDKLARWIAPYFEDDAVCKSCFFLPTCQGTSCPLERIENDTRPCPSEKTQIGPTLKALWSEHRARARQHSVDVGDARPQELSPEENAVAAACE